MEDSRDEVWERSSDEGLSRSPTVRRIGEPQDEYSYFMVREDVGERLMELFSVQFLDHEGVNMEEIYGIIMLDCSNDPYVLFERLPGDPLPIDSKGFVKLTGPDMVHNADDCIEFHAFLCDLNERFCKTYHHVWNGQQDECLLLCNKLLVKRWDTMIGPIELCFAVFTESLTAALEVNLLDWKDKGKCKGTIMDHVDEIEVFGEITSHVKMITDARAKSYIFKREKEMCGLVRPGEAIPLSRCYTVCPIRSSIELQVALYHPSDSNLGGDDLIVNGHVEVPGIQGGYEYVLESNCACVQLKITLTD